ncbi:MAG: ADP-ribosylglycohydrolase family protein [Bacteroidota bacterium]
MLGAIIGDVVGSRFEKDNIKIKDFDLFHSACRFTDDTVLTVAIADAILQEKSYEEMVKKWGRRYPLAGYGKTFKKWLAGMIKEPYNSWGNGSAMRVSPVAYAFDSLETVLSEAQKSAEITHNHPEGIKGAQAIAAALYLIRKGWTKDRIKVYVEETFDYNLSRAIDEIRPAYEFDVSCQGSVPEAIIAFLEAKSFEDTIRTAVSIGGDTDTIASMAGALAEAFYQEIPGEIVEKTLTFVPDRIKLVLTNFQEKFITI